LEQRRKENERLVAEYRRHLEAVRSGLEAVEQAEARAGEPDQGRQGAL
jgi:hypothetical protein